MKIYFIRHGETDRNTKGQLPIKNNNQDPLNEIGRSQAREAELQIPKTGIRIMFSSPQKRAEETAAIILAGKNPGLIKEMYGYISYDSRLGEVNFGRLGGKTWEEVENIYPKESLEEKYKNQNYDFSQYYGDSYEIVKQRVYSLIKEVKEKYTDGEIVIFSTHAGVIRAVYKEEKGTIFKKAPPKNGEFHVFEF